ncbi:hypothetical protein [Streptomyces sp. NPDC050504]|uniref:hypothetical protein n=1 Tax=Streptomyces sp. NPDC050504 TaxID=3365618 RepID=UPI0037B7B846
MAAPPVMASPPFAPGGVPAFAPVRVRGGRWRPRRIPRGRRRAVAAGLAMSAAALAAAAAAPAGAGGSAPGAAGPPPGARERPAETASAPVRIADAATVRLLRPGDLVDVVAGAGSRAGAPGEARVVAAGARVAEIPRARETAADGGALVVLTVPRATAVALAGAGTTSPLAVTLR